MRPRSHALSTNYLFVITSITNLIMVLLKNKIRKKNRNRMIKVHFYQLLEYYFENYVFKSQLTENNYDVHANYFRFLTKYLPIILYYIMYLIIKLEIHYNKLISRLFLYTRSRKDQIHFYQNRGFLVWSTCVVLPILILITWRIFTEISINNIRTKCKYQLWFYELYDPSPVIWT